jgi:hypothetical protein
MSDGWYQWFTRWRLSEIQKILIAVGQGSERPAEKEAGQEAHPNVSYSVNFVVSE